MPTRSISSHSTSVAKWIKSLCIKLRRSGVVKLIILMFLLYFGGLIWFFYEYAANWTQLYRLCYQSSAEFVVGLYHDSLEYSPFIMLNRNSQTGVIHTCDVHDITCEMERQQQQSGSKQKSRDHCLSNIRDEAYHEREVPHTLMPEHKRMSLNKLLFDMQTLEEDEHTLSMLLNLHETKAEFLFEYMDCASKSRIYLTSFTPVIGFHVICVYHFADHSQSLYIVYQHGFNKPNIPPFSYKNRKRCIVRAVKGLNGTYYVTNECQRVMSHKESNPQSILISIKNMKHLRRHLQNHIIKDIASYDEYTIEGWDISKQYVKDNMDDYQNYHQPTFDPTKSPETDKLYDRLQSLREGKKKNTDIDPPYTLENTTQQATVITKYKKNPFTLYYPNGESISLYMSANELFNIKSVVFMFEGGRFMWPGVEQGHVIRLSSGIIELKTLNLRPLVFEISGLITQAEVEWLRNKALPGFNRSEVGLNEEKKVSNSRTCESAWLFGKHDLIVNSLKKRCERILQIPMTHMEDMEVVRYKKGQRFDMHYDAFQQHDGSSTQSQLLLHGGFKNRIATILYYLSDVKENSGGYTVFPRFDGNLEFDEHGTAKFAQKLIITEKCCNDTEANRNYALRIKPSKGKTILFYNMLPNGELDNAVLHAGCELQSGQKWASNQWIWNRPFGQ
eukprot:341784_1